MICENIKYYSCGDHFPFGMFTVKAITLALIIITLLICATVIIIAHMNNKSRERLHNEKLADAEKSRLCPCDKMKAKKHRK